MQTGTNGSASAATFRKTKARRIACAARRSRKRVFGSTVRATCIVTFVSDRWEGEYMHLFHAKDFTGSLRDCDEGVLEWVPKENVHALPQWEGDKIFLRLLEQETPFFSLKLRYEGEALREAVLNGEMLNIEE